MCKSNPRAATKIATLDIHVCMCIYVRDQLNKTTCSSLCVYIAFCTSLGQCVRAYHCAAQIVWGTKWGRTGLNPTSPIALKPHFPALADDFETSPTALKPSG